MFTPFFVLSKNGVSDDCRIVLFHLRLILELPPCYVQVWYKSRKWLFHWYWARELWPGFAFLVGISANHRSCRTIVYSFSFSMHNLLNDNEKKLSMVVISPSRLCTRNVFWNSLGLECRFHWMDNQIGYLKTRGIEDVPEDGSIFLWLSFGRLCHWFCLEHHWINIQYIGLSRLVLTKTILTNI